MAQAKPQTESSFAFIDDDSAWETVQEESGRNLTFENVGDQFVGQYVGTQTIHNPKDDSDFDQQQFRDKDGTLWAINGGFKIREATKDLPVGSVVRITYMGSIDTGQPSPMKDYRVEAQRGSVPSPTTEESATE